MASIIPIQNIKLPEEVIVELECYFEIEKFQAYKPDEKIRFDEVKFAGMDVAWCMEVIPILSEKNASKLALNIDVKSEDLWNSNKYQYLVQVKCKDTTFITTNFQNIGKEFIRKSALVSYEFLLGQATASGACPLTVKIEIRYLGEKALRKMLDTTTIRNHHLMYQSSYILNDPTISDFTFLVKEKEFKVHKAIVGSASEVMRKMFITDLMESNQGQCKINHIEPNIFDNLIRFIYTGQIPMNLSVIASELFQAADYYGITNLMNVCEQDMQFRLCTENAIEMLELASIYDMKNLKLDAWKIVKSQILKIFYPLNNEPLSMEDIREIINLKEKENEFWMKHKKPTMRETVSKDSL